MKKFSLGIIVLLLCMFISVNCQAINYFGTAFSPYVKSDGSYWNSYTVEDIKKMLRIASKRHNSISTYSMGVSEWNYKGPWDRADSTCLVARAASQINKDRQALVLSVSQGIYQNGNPKFQQKEISNAFLAAEEANKLWRGTVWGITFTNEYVVNTQTGQKVLEMINNNKQRAHSMGLKVGTRVHICGEIWNGKNKKILIEIAKSSDYIMCNLYPGRNSNNVDKAVKGISDAYYSARDGFWRYNPNLEVIIGETGWASEGKTFFNPQNLNTVEKMKNFWNAMKNWATKNRVKVQMFQAFDEPWKTGLSGEKHFGWWKRAADNSNHYIEKATGKIFN